MTVEEYLRSLVPGLDLEDTVLSRAVRSPIEVGLERLALDDDEEDYDGDEDFQKRLDYASSTVFYSVLGVFAGGGYSEQTGDVRASRGGYIIAKDDRARFQAMGDALRKKWGWETEDDASYGEMFDASSLRNAVHRFS